jgi:hypothetical protein
MDDIIFRISRHYITGIAGIIGLSAATYFIQRYLSNNEKTTSSYYTRSDELDIGNNLVSQLSTSKKIYIFWNSSFNSTYLLLDYLQQDYIVQPIYIERYTIRKALEYEKLERYTTEYNQSKLQTNSKCSQVVLEYLADVAKMKRQQSQEISRIATLRRVITNQYPEFRANLLPTRYITTIEKDLAHSQRFYDALRELDLPHLEYAGIELYEQASRYIAHMSSSAKQTEITPNQKTVMGYSQDSHLTSIIYKIKEKIEKDLHTNTNTNANSNSRHKIDLPLSGISNKIIKYLASEKINKEVMRFLNS